MHLPQNPHLYTFVIGLIVLTLLLSIFLISIIRQHKSRMLFFKQQVIRDMQLIEEERKRIALDLHDDLGSVLATVSRGLNSISCIIPEEIIVRETIQNLDQSMSRMKAIANNLVPQMLEEHGLFAAIDDLLSELNSSSFNCTMFATGSDTDFAPEKSLVLFRVVQEIITNVVKHAHATAVKITAAIDDWYLLLIISDNGIGFDPKQHTAGRSFGLSNIRTRLNLLNASYSIDSSILEGTTYIIKIPITSLHKS